jgi:GntR family transcriptional regulator
MSDQESSSSAPYVTPQQGDAWAADAAGRGKTGTQRLLDVETVDPSSDVRRALELHTGEHVVVRRRLILLDDRPVELADSYYRVGIAAETALATRKKIRGGAVTLLASMGHVISEIVEEITARLADPDERALLEIGEHEPLIILTRLSRDSAGTPIEYAVNRMVANVTPPLTYRTRTSTA